MMLIPNRCCAGYQEDRYRRGVIQVIISCNCWQIVEDKVLRDGREKRDGGCKCNLEQGNFRRPLFQHHPLILTTSSLRSNPLLVNLHCSPKSLQAVEDSWPNVHGSVCSGTISVLIWHCPPSTRVLFQAIWNGGSSESIQITCFIEKYPYLSTFPPSNIC